MVLTKKDVVVILACGIFLLANLGAISQSGRQQAKALMCASNMHQASKVAFAYASDFDGYLPGMYNYSYTPPEPISSLGRYV